MRNRYPGTCYRCGGHVAAGAGHFERHSGSWRVQHADCAIKHRKAAANPPTPSLKLRAKDIKRATGTTRSARRVSALLTSSQGRGE